jgi:hypothetical protein
LLSRQLLLLLLLPFAHDALWNFAWMQCSKSIGITDSESEILDRLRGHQMPQLILRLDHDMRGIEG